VAWILASRGKRVLVVDWDLDSPGLHKFFRPFLDGELFDSTPGEGGALDITPLGGKSMPTRARCRTSTPPLDEAAHPFDTGRLCWSGGGLRPVQERDGEGDARDGHEATALPTLGVEPSIVGSGVREV
ncbi:MAG TPA: hypothetical protein VI248_04645, partial [Kineosporiaceae bacterium]